MILDCTIWQETLPNGLWMFTDQSLTTKQMISITLEEINTPKIKLEKMVKLKL